jgi:hypothetical protein
MALSDVAPDIPSVPLKVGLGWSLIDSIDSPTPHPFKLNCAKWRI